MSSFLEVIWSNSPVLVALVFLFVRIMRLEITMKSEFSILRSEMRQGDKNLEHRIEMETQSLRNEINDLRRDMTQQGNDIRAEMKEGFTNHDHELEKSLLTLKISRNDDLKTGQQ